MSARVLRFEELLKSIIRKGCLPVRSLNNSQLSFLIELFFNISHLSFTLKEQAYLKRRIELIRSVSKIRSARKAREALKPLSSTLLPILAKAALKL